MLRKLWALAVKAGLNVFLVGPAGSGKTTLAGQLAKLIKARFGFLSCTQGMSESQLTGWLLPTEANGAFAYRAAPFVEIYTGGGVFLLDELDRADANTILVLNAALANGHLAIPHNLKSPVITRSKAAVLIGAGNTTGGGADEIYSAAGALDGSTIDRFYMLEVGYDEGFEAALAGIEGGKRRSWHTVANGDVHIKAAFDWVKALRAQVTALKIPRIVSTRMFQKFIAALRVGIPVAEIKADLLCGWDADTLRRLGAAVK